MKMQEVSFKNIHEFLEFLPGDERMMVDKLRKLIFDCAPEATEKLSFNVPFYKQRRNFCFIWPASVLWGKQKTYHGVRLGFTNGYLMTDENDFLEKGNRKQVYWHDFPSIREIDGRLVNSYIFEALSIDDSLYRNKPGQSKNSSY